MLFLEGVISHLLSGTLLVVISALVPWFHQLDYANYFIQKETNHSFVYAFHSYQCQEFKILCSLTACFRGENGKAA